MQRSCGREGSRIWQLPHRSAASINQWISLGCAMGQTVVLLNTPSGVPRILAEISEAWGSKLLINKYQLHSSTGWL